MTRTTVTTCPNGHTVEVQAWAPIRPVACPFAPCSAPLTNNAARKATR